MNAQAKSDLISVDELFFCTEALPFFAEAAVLYISLEPISQPFKSIALRYENS